HDPRVGARDDDRAGPLSDHTRGNAFAAQKDAAEIEAEARLEIVVVDVPEADAFPGDLELLLQAWTVKARRGETPANGMNQYVDSAELFHNVFSQAANLTRVLNVRDHRETVSPE